MSSPAIRRICRSICAAILLACAACTAGSHASDPKLLLFYAMADSNLESELLHDLDALSTSTGCFLGVLIDRSPAYSTASGDWMDTRAFCKTPNGIMIETNIPPLGLSVQHPEELNTADPEILSGFIEYFKEQHPGLPTVLVIGSHGSAWLPPSGILRSIGYDGEVLQHEMRIPALADALSESPVDLLILDSCLMGNVETLYELRHAAPFITASTAPIPQGGYDFEALVRGTVASSANPQVLCIASIVAWEETYGPAMTGYDTAALAKAVESGPFADFATSLAADSSAALALRATATPYTVAGSDDHVDLIDLARSSEPELAYALEQSIAAGRKRVSIFFPPSAVDYTDYYETLEFADISAWDELLRSTLGL